MKRFTETTKWSDPWFRKLTPRLKCVWIWLCDSCDPAGVVEPDWELVTFQVGEPVSTEDLKHFERQLEKLGENKFQIRKFIHFQCGVLSHACKPHAKVFEALDRHGLKVPANVLQTPQPGRNGPTKPAAPPTQTATQPAAATRVFPRDIRSNIEYVEDLISKHPANPDSTYEDPNATVEQKADLKKLRVERDRLRRVFYDMTSGQPAA